MENGTMDVLLCVSVNTRKIRQYLTLTLLNINHQQNFQKVKKRQCQ